ncbi:MAG: LysE family transporter [Oscillospiraceae bacterium]|nr:LysE family transporter [Oscillospiraceae bacterium]
MPRSIIPSFLIYCFIACITPGPANLCTLSAALHYGKETALRQWRGLIAGFFIDALLAVVINRLLGTLLGSAVSLLSWVGAAYILWMAWRILKSAGAEPDKETQQPNFITGLLLNLTNVKVILFCITALGTFVLPYTRSLPWLLGTAVVLTLMGPGSNLVWLFLGAKLQKLLHAHQKTVDIVMAISLALCAVSLVIPR